MMQTPKPPLLLHGLSSIIDGALAPEHLQALLGLSLSRDATFPQQLQDYLTTGCHLLGMASGIIGQAEANRHEIIAAVNPLPGREVGDEYPIEDTYYATVIERSTCTTYSHISQMEEIQSHPASQNMPFENYLGAPIWSEGRLTGTLCFGEEAPRTQEFTATERTLVETLAMAIGQVMDRHRAQQRMTRELNHLRLAYEEMELLFSRCHHPMALMDFTGHWTRLNPALSQLVGIEASDLHRGTLEDISHPQDMLACQEALAAMHRGDIRHFSQPHRYLSRQGQLIETMLHLELIDTHSGVILSQHKDISEQRTHEESLARLRHKLAALSPESSATHTGSEALMPLEFMEQQLDNEIARSARHGDALSLLMLNLDALTDFNRQFGRGAGDRAMRHVIAILRQTTRKSDLISLRSDGTLVAVLTSTDASGAIIMAERIRQAAADAHGLDSPLTCSIGLTCYHPTPDTQTLISKLELFERAQHALKKAKRQGRNCVRLLDLEPMINAENSHCTSTILSSNERE